MNSCLVGMVTPTPPATNFDREKGTCNWKEILQQFNEKDVSKERKIRVSFPNRKSQLWVTGGDLGQCYMIQIEAMLK